MEANGFEKLLSRYHFYFKVYKQKVHRYQFTNTDKFNLIIAGDKIEYC